MAWNNSFHAYFVKSRKDSDWKVHVWKKSARHNDACLGSVICMLVYCYLGKWVYLHVLRLSILCFSHHRIFPLEVGSFLGGHINLNRGRFADGAFAGFSSDISVLAGADQAFLWYYLVWFLPGWLQSWQREWEGTALPSSPHAIPPPIQRQTSSAEF